MIDDYDTEILIRKKTIKIFDFNLIKNNISLLTN
jgi:hypothetical protein